jgi:acyl-coenzyme A synthetase/AMP-(fatty) acid ligase
MSGHASAMAPQYVRLSGEIADQALLDRLRDAYPAARVSHAFASTEAGVAFDVTDGLAGFPAAWVSGDAALPGIDLRVADGTLRIRSTRTATGYLGAAPLHDGDGFVDTGDIVTLDGGRYHFCGRMGGIINVGGQKVHPEEVEAALATHPAVLAARVRAQANPITGAIVTAEIVVKDPAAKTDRLRHEIIEASRARLAPHKVPALLRFVTALEMLPSGKMARLA